MIDWIQYFIYAWTIEMDMLSKKYFLLELPFFLLEIDTSQLAKNEKIVPDMFGIHF